MCEEEEEEENNKNEEVENWRRSMKNEKWKIMK